MHAAEVVLDLLDHALGDRDDGNVFLPWARLRAAMQKTREYIRLAKAMRT